MSDVDRGRLVARRDHALDDLAEVEAQLADGELDEAGAAALRRRYAAEAADAIAALATFDAAPPAEPTSRKRTLATVGAMTAVVALAAVALLAAVEPRPPGGFITGGVAADVAREGGVDLARVTNEELESVVAANPEVIGMRLALARRYVEAGDFSAAFPHYMAVLERQPDEPQALMYLGWMTYVSGDAATGVALLERSLALAPDNTLARWFLANALLHGLEDGPGAIPLLEAVIADPLTPEHIIEQAGEMLDDARGVGT